MSKATKSILSIIAASGILAMAAAPAQAQSTEEVLGAVVGGSAGAVVGGELDNKGSNTEGVVIGAIVGGVAGAAVGDAIDDDNDRRFDDRRDGRTTVIRERNIYVDTDGNRKSHPVHGTNPGKGHSEYKNRR